MIPDHKFKIFARALVTNSEGLILKLKKSETQKIAPGLWLLPGGSIEFGETPEDGLRRELLEEISFEATDLKLVSIETRIISDTHWLGLIYEVQGDTSRVRNNELLKHVEMKWCAKSDG